MKALTKTSSNEEIKAYFKAVFELSRSEEYFPVDIDEVWMLVYNRRDCAIDALKKEFIDNVDYACTSVKTEVGSTKYKYHITVSCLEYFIARKVRPVFEVYYKNQCFFLYVSYTIRIFVVRKLFIIYDMGIFYAHKAAYILKHIEKLYPCFIDHMSIKGFRRLGYDFSFLFIIK
mgnify:CR=1 FL=1